MEEFESTQISLEGVSQSAECTENQNRERQPFDGPPKIEDGLAASK